jgi:hypothetical protein
MSYRKFVQEVKLWGFAIALSVALAAAHYVSTQMSYSTANAQLTTPHAISASAGLF